MPTWRIISAPSSASADMSEIYLDNSATTALCEEAKAAMLAAMENFGNPSSLHERGQKAAALLKESRAAIGEALGERYLKDGQLIFTGSGTEATTLALLGTARAKERRVANTILTTDSAPGFFTRQGYLFQPPITAKNGDPVYVKPLEKPLKP